MKKISKVGVLPHYRLELEFDLFMPETSRFFGIVIKMFSMIATRRTFTQNMGVRLRS